MNRVAVLIAFSATALLDADIDRALADGVCPTTPQLHHSIEAGINECTGVIHNTSGASGFGNSPGQLPEVRAEGYYDRGLLYEFEGKYESAIADFTSAIGWQHDYGDAYEARGDALEDLKEPEKADADYRTAKGMGGDDAARCWTRAVRGHPLDRALADCNEALKADPGDKDILQSRCFVYYRMANYTSAIDDCAAAEKSHPHFDEALYIGGLAKLQLGDTAGGNADIAAARDANFQIADYYALFGVKP